MSTPEPRKLSSKESVWWREPMVWLIIALPMAAIIGAFITLWFALNRPDPLVSEDYYKEGLAVHQRNQQEQLAIALGITAEVAAVDAGRLDVRLDGRYAGPPRSLTLTLFHPTDSGQDIVLEARPEAVGLYRATLPALTAGKRRLVITAADQAWKLSGQWEAPFTGTLRLSGEASTSTTSP